MSGINSSLVELNINKVLNLGVWFSMITVKELCFVFNNRNRKKFTLFECLNTMKKFSFIYWKIELQNDEN